MLFALLLPSFAAGQTGSDAEQRAFISAARETASHYEDRALAIRSGYRRVGPDFPGMGEHWVHPGRIVRGSLDPTQPPVLSYVDVGGHSMLVGVAYALPLRPGEHPPEGPFDPNVWHDHSASVDEETLLINSPSSMHAAGHGARLSMVHVWTGLENPDGILAQNNWALPFWRLGLPVPDSVSEKAARGLSLAGSGERFYRELIRRASSPSETELAEVEEILHVYASRTEDAVGRQRSASFVDQAVFEALWKDFWGEVSDVLSEESWVALSGFAGS